MIGDYGVSRGRAPATIVPGGIVSHSAEIRRNMNGDRRIGQNEY
jgi:hypothetical protein